MIVMRSRFHREGQGDSRSASRGSCKDLKIDGVLCDQILAGRRDRGPTGRHSLRDDLFRAALARRDRSAAAVHALALRRGPRPACRNRLGYAGWHWFIGPTLRMINRYRRRWGFPPFGGSTTFSRRWRRSPSCAKDSIFPAANLPPHFHYIGSLASNRQADNDFQFPWDRLDGRPLIFASLGTVPYPANLPVFRKIAEACIGVDAQLVLALGKWNEEEEKVQERLGTLPGDHVVVDFAPQLKLLDRAALMITHAGVNTVLEAISRGVPMVALPRGDDQAGMGSRIVHSGTGLRGSFRHSTRGGDPGHGPARAHRRQLPPADHGLEGNDGCGGRPAIRAADIAEEALTTGRPVRYK